MKKEIEIVYSKAVFSQLDMVRIPKEDIKNIINNRLTRGIAEFITEHMDELPIIITSTPNMQINADEYTLKMILISQSELQRLKMIENLYNNLLAILPK